MIHFHFHVFISLPTLYFIVNFYFQSLLSLLLSLSFPLYCSLGSRLYIHLELFVLHYSLCIIHHLACLLWYLVYSSFYLSLSLLFKLLECPFLFRLVSLSDHLSSLFIAPSSTSFASPSLMSSSSFALSSSLSQNFFIVIFMMMLMIMMMTTSLRAAAWSSESQAMARKTLRRV